MEEYLDIVDEYGNPTGEKQLRSVVHEKGLWHRTVHVYFYRKVVEEIELLVHLRSKFKSSHPNEWDTRFGGHVESGQTVEETAFKEVIEEAGIKIELKDLIVGPQRRYNGEKNKEIIQSFYYNFNGELDTLSFDDGEVQAVKWVSISDIRNAIKSENDWVSSIEGFETIISDMPNKLL